MTYARLEDFLDFQVMNAHYAPFMEMSQREGFSNAQKQNYSKDQLSTKDSKKNQVTDATSKISFALILNKTERDSQQHILKQQLTILKQLMVVLYKGQPFFEEAEKNPALLDQLFEALMNDADHRAKKITRMRDLSTVSLGNETLQNILYHALQGTAKSEDENKDKKEKKPLSPDNPEEPLAKEGDEGEPSKEGYVSLFDFITLAKGPKIRMFLAPKEILQAVYGKDSSTVNKVIEVRKELFRQIENEKMEPDIANQKFKDEFRNSTPRELSTDEILDFTIRKGGAAVPKAPPHGKKGENLKKANS